TDLLCHSLATLRPQIVDDDTAAFLGESLGDPLAETGAASRHDRDLVLQPHDRPPPWFSLDAQKNGGLPGPRRKIPSLFSRGPRRRVPDCRRSPLPCFPSTRPPQDPLRASLPSVPPRSTPRFQVVSCCRCAAPPARATAQARLWTGRTLQDARGASWC